MLNVILAEGLNLGLSKMAGASSTHSFTQLARLSNWHVESEAINWALATVNEAPYILDGLLMNPTGKRIKEQYADTGGFIDLVFAAT